MRQKIVLLLLCCCTALNLHAQGEQSTFVDDANFVADMNAIFQNVSMTEANTGFLYDIGMRFDDLKRFDGTALTDDNLTDMDIFGGAYATSARKQQVPSWRRTKPCKQQA